MLRRFYTVMIVPHEGGALRRLNVSSNFIVSMAGVFLFCFVSSAFLAHFFLDGMHRMGHDDALRARAERQTVEMTNMEARFQVLASKVDDMTARLEEYTLIVDTSAPPSRGMGGRTEEETLAALALEGGWRATGQAAEDKVDYWMRWLEERICTEQTMPALGDYLLPVSGSRITSRYGWRRDPMNGKREFHEGMDFAAPHGTPVVVVRDGVVVEARRRGGYGNMVRVDHGDGVETLYGHLRRFVVKEGARVKRGQLIGEVGSTGRSTGPHLHFEVFQDGRTVDPESLPECSMQAAKTAGSPRPI